MHVTVVVFNLLATTIVACSRTSGIVNVAGIACLVLHLYGVSACHSISVNTSLLVTRFLELHHCFSGRISSKIKYTVCLFVADDSN